MRARTLATYVLGAAALAVPAAAAVPPPGLLTGLGNGRQFVVRPAQISYTGDGTGQLGGFDGNGRGHFGHLRWSRWTHREALGAGAVWIDNCMPDCAQGGTRRMRSPSGPTPPRAGTSRA